VNGDLAMRVGRLSPARQVALLARLVRTDADQPPADPKPPEAVGVTGPPLGHADTTEGADELPYGSAPAASAAPTAIVPLLPAQRLLLDQLSSHAVDPNAFAIMSVVQSGRPLRPDHLANALTHLIARHDALRLRFSRNDQGWVQKVVESPPATRLEQFDLADVPPRRRAAAVIRAAQELRHGLDLLRGPVAKLALLQADPGSPSLLLLVVHHLVADAYSVALLWSDLWSVYEALERSDTPRLPPATSVQNWIERLVAYGASPALDRDAEYWRGHRWSQVSPLPARDTTESPKGDLTSVRASLAAVELGAVLRALPPGSQLPEAVLTALVTALRRWVRADAFVVTVVRHGRAQPIAGVEVARTVGWLTAHPPVIIELPGWLSFTPSVRRVTEQLGQVPLDGLAWEFARERVIREKPEWLDRLRQTRTVFDYLGADITFPAGLRPALDDVNEALDPPHVWGNRTLLVAAQVRGGELHLKITHDGGSYSPDVVATLLADMIDFLRSAAIATKSAADSSNPNRDGT
jgi:hypothetical protein